MFDFGFFPIGRQCLEVFDPIILLRPAIDRGGCAKKVHREAHPFAVAAFEGADERRAEDLACELLALEVDQAHVAGEAFGDDSPQVVDEFGIS